MVSFGAAFDDLLASLRRQQEASTAAGATGQPSTTKGAGHVRQRRRLRSTGLPGKPGQRDAYGSTATGATSGRTIARRA